MTDEQVHFETPEQLETRLLEEAAERAVAREPLSDVVITQGVICVLLALGLAVLNLVRPDTAGELLERVRRLAVWSFDWSALWGRLPFGG